MKNKLCGSICLWCLAVMAFCACGKQELADMTTEAGNDYAAIIWEDRTYVPYCAVSKRDCGKQIGIVDGDEDDRVYEYQGFSRDEWIVNCYVSGLMDSCMLYREMNVSDIPDGKESEYEWNK